MKRITYLPICTLCLLMASCASQRKLSYFRAVDAAAADSINAHYQPKDEPVVVKGDQLLISVSALDPEAAAPFNLPAATFQAAGEDKVLTTQTLQRYTVDKDGNIEMPVLGVVPVEGLSKSQLIDDLKNRLAPLIKDPIVNVQFGSFYVSVLGEVKNPGKYQVLTDRCTLLDALALAGDLTIYGKRQNVLLTRETNGKLEFTRFNLNAPEILTSPYFFLQQNDVIYVEPNNARALSSQNVSLYLSMLTTMGSMATVIVSVVNSRNDTGDKNSGNNGQ